MSPESIPKKALAPDLEAIANRLEMGDKYGPALMRRDVVYLLKVVIDINAAIAAAEATESKSPTYDAALILLKNNLGEVAHALQLMRETNGLMQEQITNLQKWLRERHLWTDEQLDLLKTVSPAELRAFFETKKEKPREGAPD